MADLNQPQSLFPTNFTEEEAAAQIAFQLQIQHTADTINRLNHHHPHFADDCGDELRNSLDLSLHLTNGAIFGSEDLKAALDDLLNPEHELYIGNFISYASDGLMQYCIAHGFKEEEE